MLAPKSGEVGIPDAPGSSRTPGKREIVLERGGKRGATPLWFCEERRGKFHALPRAKVPSPLRSAGALQSTLTAYRKPLIHQCVIGKRRISEADSKKVRAHE